jgi:NAD(P)-dependent dehydrogenase (short-subunit alcohol dehydrogenase family)
MSCRSWRDRARFGRERIVKLVSGQVAVVTGAASGIGLALATALAERGLLVAMADVEEQRLEQARVEIESTVPQSVL